MASRWSSLRPFVRSSVLVLALTASAWAGPETTRVGETRIVYAPGGTVLRAEPSATGAPLGSLPKGTSVVVLEVVLPWTKVQGSPGPGKPSISGWVRAYQAVEPAQFAAAPPPAALNASGAAGVSARDVAAAGREFSEETERGYRVKHQDLERGYALVNELERATAKTDPGESIEFMIDGAIGRPGSSDYVLPGRVPASPAPKGSKGGGSNRGNPLGGLGGFLKEGAKRVGLDEDIVDGAEKIGKIANVMVKARVEQLNSNFTPDQEYYLGRAVAANALAKYGVEPNPALRAYVRRVGDAIVRTAPAARVPANYGGYHFEVLASDDVNGVSGPGGFVLITRGALRACRTEDEVAGLIAHELAHITREHAERVLRAGKQWKNQMNTFTGVASVALGVDDQPFVGGLVDLFTTAVGESVRTSTEHSYGSALEYEADLEGSYILADAWYDWWSIRNLLVILGQSGHVHGGAEHASPQQRAAALEPRLMQIGRFTPKEWVPVERRRRLDEVLGRTPPAPATAPVPAPAPAPGGWPAPR